MVQHFAKPANTSWIELEALLRDYQLGLVVVAGSDDETRARPVQWVHSSDLTDPTPFLTPRTVLLTTGEQFKSTLSKSIAEAYVERLVRAGTSALGVAVGLKWDRIPPTLVEACDRLGLPLIRVPYDTPFIAITRTASRLLEAAMRERTTPKPSSSPAMSAARVARAEAALRSAVLKLLIAGQVDLAAEIASSLMPRLPRGQVAVVSADSSGESPALTALGAGTVYGHVGDRLLAIVETRRVTATRKALAGTAAGISEHGSLANLELLVDQADRALEHARATDGDSAAPSIISYKPSMHAGVLQFLESSADAKRRAEGFLSPVRTHDARHHDDIARSLEVWLRHNGQLAPSSEELGIHRHTLRARVRTAASLLQRDIDSPDTRAELWTALRITAPATTR